MLAALGAAGVGHRRRDRIRDLLLLLVRRLLFHLRSGHRGRRRFAFCVFRVDYDLAFVTLTILGHLLLLQPGRVDRLSSLLLLAGELEIPRIDLIRRHQVKSP